MHCRAEVGGEPIGIVHGDAESLAGWGFAHEAMRAPGTAAPRHIADWFERAGVIAFASSHTCLPFVQEFEVGGARRVLINNGAAGMPNFRATTYGVLTRVSSRAAPHERLYGTAVRGVHFDALAIRYDQAKWVERFERNWPAGSPGHASYFKRVVAGPDFEPRQAQRLA